MPDLWQEPFRELEDLWERMGRMFDPGWTVTRAGVWQPMVDVEETGEAGGGTCGFTSFEF